MPSPIAKNIRLEVLSEWDPQTRDNFQQIEQQVKGLQTSAVFPIGVVLAIAGDIVPDGWLLCDGLAVKRDQYAQLFKVIGTKHGTGDGSTTYNIPDYRSRFLRGRDGGVGRDPVASSRTAMQTGGAVGDLVGSVQDNLVTTTLDSGAETRLKNAAVNFIIKY